MTTRLYYRDAELLAFDAQVIEHAGDSSRVVLDQTAFYPTSGGQPHDVGMLGHARVLDVVDEDTRIVHVLEAPLPLGPVHGVVDGARRHDHMQQHTAQHLISALAADRLRWETESVHFGADHSTIEFATAAASDVQLEDLEAWSNGIVAEARPVTVGFEDAKAAVATGLRKAPPREGEIRVITIDGIDRSACGGTHVANTAAIGAVLLRGVEKIRGRIRVGFLSGERVLRHARQRDALVDALAQQLSCSAEELLAIVTKRVTDVKELRSYSEELEKEVAVARVEFLLGAATPDANGIRRVVHRADRDAPALHRAMVQRAGAVDDAVLVIAALDPPAIYLAAGANSGVEAGAALKAALTAAGGRGGGAPRVAQGSVPTREALEHVLSALSRAG